MSNKFTDYLIQQQPAFDKLLLADYRPMDCSWIGACGSYGEVLYQRYVKSVEAVRRLVEGLAYQPGGAHPYVAKEWEYDFMSKMGFNAPVVQGEWMEDSHTIDAVVNSVGEPCDPNPTTGNTL